MRRALRHLTDLQIRAARAYYAAHQAEGDAGEARYERAIEALFTGR